MVEPCIILNESIVEDESAKKMRKHYIVEGNNNGYPKLVLCDRCVQDYVVISEGERTYDECAKCGEDD